ncbi:iron chelate uptake ABC transporter family permease subunit, partial [Nodularia spumigena]|uniref:Iron chelate uptake ABC transporter family permease subunit n=1 Tax=Nodularia spumigena UHCC 0060 TaxID=3110300 RepID=A0ABU5UW30_NODSP
MLKTRPLITGTLILLTLLFLHINQHPTTVITAIFTPDDSALHNIVRYIKLPRTVIPIGAFIGAVVAFGVVYVAAWQNGVAPARLALVGIAVSAFCAAGINLLVVN